MLDDIFPTKQILAAYRGSVSHGTTSEKSDTDLIGCYVAPLNFYCGFDTKDTYEFVKDGYDCVTYEIRKLVRLLIQCNPNLICFINSEFVIHDPIADTLIENRDLFLTTKAYHSFSKYALGQLERMTRTTPEEIKLISYLEKKLAENDISVNFPIVMAQNERNMPINASIGDKVMKSKGQLLDFYLQEKKRIFPGSNLGLKRKKLIEEFGYDCKNASHAIRLLKMGLEILRDGKVIVDRSEIDSDMLIDIKAGKWSLKEVQEYAASLYAEVNRAYEKTTLPDEVIIKKVESILVDIIAKYHAI
jgi:hypothetical protein